MQTTDQQTRLLTAKTLMDEPVRNTMGDNIGKVEDYMLDLQNGCVEYAVLSFGGFLGIGEKYFAVPWHSFTLDTERHCFVLDIDKNALENAPGFDRNDWPMAEQNEYRSSVDSYWRDRRPGVIGSGGARTEGAIGSTRTRDTY